MATIQIQRPKTITETAIVQKQSLESVQMMIHGGLSSLSYLRCLFPEKAYAKRVYGEDGDLPSYKDFAANNLPIGRRLSSSSTSGTTMQLLERGKSRRVDLFLDWMENGAFPAIQSGRLRALHVFVHADPDDRTKVLESYKFTVKYVRDADNTPIPDSIGVGDSEEAETVTVGDTSHSLQSFLRRTMELCEDLPTLPAKRYVSAALIFDQDQTIPSGWSASTADTVFLAEGDGWTRHDEILDDIFSRFHDTTFEISYLQDSQRRSIPPQDPPTIPDELDYARERPLEEDRTEKSDTAAAAEGNGTNAHTGLSISSAPQHFTRSTDAPNEPIVESVPTEMLSLQSDTSIRSQDTQQSFAPARNVSGLHGVHYFDNTQSSNVAEMKAAFGAMMQPEQMTQGDTQSQGPFTGHRFASETTASPSRGLPSPLTMQKVAAPMVGMSLELSQSAVARLDSEKASKNRAKHQSKSLKKKTPEVTACQCGHVLEEGDMVTCSVCDTWQHLHCYGFTGSADARIPEVHVCYKCLLGTAEPQILEPLRELAQKRRVMHLALHERSRKTSDMAVSLQLPVSTIEHVLEDLRREGYVVPTLGAKKQKASKLALTACKEGPVRQKMLQELFDPLVLISHHYRTPSNAQEATLTKGLIDQSAIEMPPPATPASRLVRLAQTPAGQSRRSETPSEAVDTPSRYGSQIPTRNKRAREHGTADAEGMSRAKRVQTQFLLDAGGLSSSPAHSAFG